MKRRNTSRYNPAHWAKRQAPEQERHTQPMSTRDGLRFPGGIAAGDLAKQERIHGRPTAIKNAVAASYKNLCRNYPDLDRHTIVVDICDIPGAGAVQWTFHTGDRVPSVLARQYTMSKHAAEYLGDFD